MYPALLRVTKVVNWNEKSQYVLILFQGLEKDSAVREFGRNKLATFKLKRRTFCDARIDSLLNPGLAIDNGKIVNSSQTFTLVPGVSKESLPLRKKVPCYFVANDNNN